MKDVIRKRIDLLNNEDFIEKYLQIIHLLLPVQLDKKEIDVLSSFLSLDKSITEDDMFNTFARKKVKDKLSLSSAGLSNYLRTLIDKAYLLKNKQTGTIKVNPIIIPKSNDYEFIINIKESNDTTK